MADVTVLQPGEYEELAAFMAGFPGVKAKSAASWLGRLRAWWDLNPAFDAAFPRGWLLRDGGKIGGFFGSLPLRMQLGGEDATVFAATSWRVLPEYRGKSLTLKLRQLAEHKAQLHFSTTPRDDLVPLLQRLGYQPIDRGPAADSQSQFILDCGKFWRVRFRESSLGPPIATVAAPVLAAVQSMRTRRSIAARPGDVRELPRADAAFDDLWQRTRTRWANTNVRTAEMVNWYCFAMRPSDRRLLASYRDGRLLGFMVLLVKDEPDRKFAECVDVWIDPAAGEGAVLAGLVAKAVDCARRESWERVLFPHFDSRTAGLYASLGLLSGPAWKKREYVKGPPELMRTITLDNSYFVRAQGDYGL
jgi:hypothetical protein